MGGKGERRQIRDICGMRGPVDSKKRNLFGKKIVTGNPVRKGTSKTSGDGRTGRNK